MKNQHEFKVLLRTYPGQREEDMTEYNFHKGNEKGFQEWKEEQEAKGYTIVTPENSQKPSIDMNEDDFNNLMEFVDLIMAKLEKADETQSLHINIEMAKMILDFGERAYRMVEKSIEPSDIDRALEESGLSTQIFEALKESELSARISGNCIRALMAENT